MQVEKLKTIDADTLLSTPMNKTLFVVDGLIPQGLSVLSGSSKIGKSWLMLWLGIQVASGQPVWEFETHKSDVLYLCLEDTYARVQSRLYKITDEAPTELRIAITSFQIGNGLEEQIEQYLTDFPQTKLVIIDTFQKVRDSKSTGGKSGMYAGDYDDVSALDAGESRNQIQRYIRLTYLTPELLAMVDNGKIAFNPAVEISYLSKDEQRILLDAMELNDCTPSHAQSIRLKKLSQEGSLDSQIIYGVMSEEKPNQKEQIKFKREDFKKYFPSNYTDEQMRKDILKGLELLRKQRERNRDAR